jgi:baseplate J-like protein
MSGPGVNRYCCLWPLRIEALRNHPSLNGLEYLEVIDRDAPSQALRQRTLLIRTVKPLVSAPPLSVWSLQGGVRVKPVRIEWVDMASNAAALFAAGRITLPERNRLQAMEAGDSLIVARTDKAGDYSTYRICAGTEDSPLPDFDARSSCIDFSFKVECPSPFDCADDLPCDSEEVPPPSIDYLSKDYDSFRALMLNRLAVTLPQWKDRSPADIGMAVVEALAAEADELSQYQDAVATEAYLSTSRRRTSLRRHARMLDYRMHEGANARAFVAIGVEAGVQNLAFAPTLPTGERVRVFSRMGKVAPVLDPAAAEPLIEERQPRVFEPMHALRLFRGHNRIAFHAWGDRNCALQPGATRATLADNLGDRLRLMPGDFLVFEEAMSPVTGLAADADPKRRHVVRLTGVVPGATADADGVRTAGPARMDVLLNVPVVEIAWDAKDTLPACLVLSATTDIDGIETFLPQVGVARGNVVLCDHGYTLPATETLENADGSEPFRPQLHERDLARAESLEAQDGAALEKHGMGLGPARASAADLRSHAPENAVPAISLVDRGGLAWSPRSDLLASDRFDPHFTIEREDDGLETVRFGDGLFGKHPSTTSGGLAIRFDAAYRIGNGLAGNVGAEALAHVAHLPGAGIESVRNPLEAEGGVDPQKREAVRIAAPAAFRRQRRAVTPEDYAATAELHPEVQKAAALRRWTGSWHTLFLSVDRRGGKDVDEAFEAQLTAFLESHRLACHDLEIVPPERMALDIAVNVCVRGDAEAADVEERLLRAFSTAALPGGQSGFFHPDNWTFGDPLYLSDLIALAQGLDGVSHVSIDPTLPTPGRFHPWAQPQRGEIDRGAIDPGGRRILRCDNDPNAPENGRIQFFMMGGL